MYHDADDMGGAYNTHVGDDIGSKASEKELLWGPVSKWVIKLRYIQGQRFST